MSKNDANYIFLHLGKMGTLPCLPTSCSIILAIMDSGSLIGYAMPLAQRSTMLAWLSKTLSGKIFLYSTFSSNKKISMR